MITLQSSSLERLSALADGELASSDFTGSEPVFQSSDLKADWNSYQVIGEALRAGAGAAVLTGAEPAFLLRLNLRLTGESVSPCALAASSQAPIAPPKQPAANEAVFRWKLVAGFASLGAALVVAWSFVGVPDASTGVQLSQNLPVEQVVVSSPQGPIVRDARLEELMAAHRQLGGSTLQAPSGFLRNAGFEDSSSGQR
jgi:sigma-E factor negative regulatory protein RseA